MAKAKELENLAFASSHNLKAPLTNIQSILELIKEMDLIKPEGEELLQDAQLVIKNTLNNTVALNKIIRLSSSGQRVKKNIDIKKELKDIMQCIDISSNTRFDFSNLAINSLFFSGEHFNILMHNILYNSYKYKSENRPLVISVKSKQNKNGSLILKICDNGIGFDSKKFKDKLFEPFTRFNTDIEGEGLGLYILKNIMKKYNGNVEIKSSEGIGTCVKLKFKS